jgi:hypothetical protein
MESHCKTLKNNLLVEDKLKTNLKAELIKEQKLMTSCSILTKELEHERAVMLLEINQSVSLNKLHWFIRLLSHNLLRGAEGGVGKNIMGYTSRFERVILRAGAMLIFSVLFQFYLMFPKELLNMPLFT